MMIFLVCEIDSCLTSGLTRGEDCFLSCYLPPTTGDEFLISNLKGMQMLSGSVSITHVKDVCQAHIFVAEEESASGRYICSAVKHKCNRACKFLEEKISNFIRSY